MLLGTPRCSCAPESLALCVVPCVRRVCLLPQRGLRVIIESLGGDEIDGLSEGHLMDYFGKLERSR